MNQRRASGRKARAAGAALAFLLSGPALGSLDAPGLLGAQEIRMPDVEASHRATLFARAENEVQEALLAASDKERDRHLDAAEQVARYLVDSDW